MNASRPSKPGLHHRHKRSLSPSDQDLATSQVYRPPRSPVRSSPGHSTQHKTLAKTSSSLSRQGKSPQHPLQQAPQPSTSTGARKSPAGKPVEKPRSPSLPSQTTRTPPNRSPTLPTQGTKTPPNRSPSLPTQRTQTPPNRLPSVPAQRNKTPPTPEKASTVKSPSSSPSQKPAVSSRPVLGKTLKTTTAKTPTKSNLPLLKSRSSGSLLKGKEATASRIASKVEEPLAVAPQHEEKELPAVELIAAEVPVVEKIDFHDELIVSESHEPDTTYTAFAAETDADQSIEQRETMPEEQEIEPEVIDLHDEVNDHEVESEVSEHDEECNDSPVNTEALEMKLAAENIEEPGVGEGSNVEDQEIETENNAALVEEASSSEEKVVEEVGIAAPVVVVKEAEAVAKIARVTPRRREVVVEKKTEMPSSNAVIEETRSKLLEERKSKVKALVGAFETVMS